MAIKMHKLKWQKKLQNSRTKVAIHSGVRVADPNHFEQP